MRVQLLKSNDDRASAPQQSIRARSAIVLCEAEGNAFQMKHEAEIKEGRLVLGHGRPISRDALLDMCMELSNQSGMEWVEDRILALGPSRIVWVMPPAVRKMLIVVGAKTIQIKSPWPRLVLSASRAGELKVFAVPSAGKVTRKTLVYHAPLFNIGHHGEMCWGSVTRPQFCAKNIGQYEEALTKSKFTHVNHARTLNLPQKDVDNQTYLRAISELKDRATFPEKLLSPTSWTLEEATQ